MTRRSERRCTWLPMVLLLLVAEVARAQNPLSFSTTATFEVNPQVRLTLSGTALTFPDSDADAVPWIPAAEGPLTITAKARNTGMNQVVLSVQASDDLRSGLNAIGISALRWSASGVGYVSGTMGTDAQTMGAWSMSGRYAGVVTFALANAWTYPTGHYGTTLVYTLSAP
jgi:hypothetical protein